ncbi:MAG TPA: LLM class flavin-dependent oxidoreductase [Candidatus Limnocylindria bacterium]|jgi:FMNH2-dependent dimethyl sulfone monooxygenase|nr:LLM class flavin-dependent oxidoreductase [Candidatus Limnocylindria bacterium]
MRFGFWMPVFGGWLRNVDDERMPATFAYQRDLAQGAERAGWDLTLIAELNLNDIKGPEADCLEAWTTAAALAPLTDRLELMTAVRPNFRLPALVAKEAATIDHISNGRFTLNVVSAWWQSESDQYGGTWVAHDERYARTAEFIAVLKGMWTQDEYSLAGRYYTVKGARLAPKPVQKPWPVLYAGGESPAAKDLIARDCDAYLMHGDPPEVLAPKIADMRARRAKRPELEPLRFGVAAYAVVRKSDAEVKKEIARITDVRASARGYASYQDFVKGSQLETPVSLEDYSVSNRGLRTGLVGTPEQVAERVGELERLGVDLVLLQCSPQREEMDRFAQEVFPLVRGQRSRRR